MVVKLTKVIVPAKPTTVAGIDVHGDIGQVELLESIGDTIAVTGGRILAGLLIGIGDEVGKRVRLDDEGDSSVRVLLEDGDDSCE